MVDDPIVLPVVADLAATPPDQRRAHLAGIAAARAWADANGYAIPDDGMFRAYFDAARPSLVAAGRALAATAVEEAMRAESDRLAQPPDARTVEWGIGVVEVMRAVLRAARGESG